MFLKFSLWTLGVADKKGWYPMFLELHQITKLYDSNNGIKDVNLSVEKGEFVTLLGPSGCGKTTTLNIIGGFLSSQKGTIILDGEDITNDPPEKRPLSTVFQSYALFHHMNVLENVCYGLRHLCKKSKKESIPIAMAYLTTVGLQGYEFSPIGKLSGGQQQRVALARAMVTNPKLLLLDEPLSNLDASLRIKMRTELKNLQKNFGITMILVTHDQEEALSLSDRIVVMDKGTILQVGTPEDIYFTPQNQFVSSFMGKVNYIETGGVQKMIRPENFHLSLSQTGTHQIQSKTFMGAKTEYTVVNETHTIEIELQGVQGAKFQVGDRVNFKVND